jgi:hypothetical protein
MEAKIVLAELGEFRYFYDRKIVASVKGRAEAAKLTLSRKAKYELWIKNKRYIAGAVLLAHQSFTV